MAEPTMADVMAEIGYLKAALHELLNRVPGRLALPPDDGDTPTTERYARFQTPQVVQVAPGIHALLVAPVTPDYEPSFIMTVTGHDSTPDDNVVPYALEPSNAREDQPPRSASGYPLRYRLDGSVVMLNADGEFANEAEIAEERRYRRERDERSKREWGGRYG